MSPASTEIDEVAAWLARSRYTVVLTGAGISTESGIPDFRSPGGVWTKYRTVYFDEFQASEAARHEYWVQKSEAHAAMHAAEPNVGHKTIAQWQEEGRVQTVITQNIDGLHQIAGSREVLELHGTAREVVCLDCGQRWPADPLVRQFLKTQQVPECGRCYQRRLKHATVSFGQSLPEEVLDQAYQACRQAELVLAVGSSLVVYPAADLPAAAKRQGAKLVIINRDETGLDPLADYVLRGGCGETLAALSKRLLDSR